MSKSNPSLKVPQSKAEPKTPKPRRTKSGTLLRLLRRPAGATVADLQKATGWQAHSVRGFLSGTVKKRMGLNLASEQDAKGARRYRIVESGAT